MRTDREVTALIDPFINIYQQIEYDIIVEIARRLSTYDEMGGALEYQLKKLSEFQQLTPAVIKVFSKYSGKSEEEIKKLLSESQSLNIDMSMLNSAYDKGIIAVDPQIVMQSQRLREIAELSYNELSQSFKLIQTKAVESANQSYMNVLNKTYVEVASGSKSLEQALKGALQDMAKRGIHGATYKHTTADGKTRYTNYSIESVVRRDTVTAVHQLANKSLIETAIEVGADYVEVSSHLGARVSLVNPIANHAGWQGGIYKINGSDGKYRNLKEATGYPDDILGLGGVNCRHRMFAFIPGVSKPNPIKYGDTEENRRIYEATQKQRKFEREIRSLKKQIAAVECVKGNDDDNILQNLKLKLKHKQSQLQEHCNANGLKRNYSRELVQEQVEKTTFSKDSSLENIKFDHISSNDKAQYARYKNILGENAPKTLDEFCKIKYAELSEYSKLQIKYRDRKLQNKIRSDYNLGIEYGKQGKHIKGHNNYRQGKSYLNISVEEAQALVNKYAGTGELQRGYNGRWKHTEKILANDKNIGYAVSIYDGQEYLTSLFKIHYSKKGTHIVPIIK